MRDNIRSEYLHAVDDDVRPSSWFWLLLVIFAVGLLVIGGAAGWYLRALPGSC